MLRINDWVGKFQLVYKKNDPMRGLVNVFQDLNGNCVEWLGYLEPTEEDLVGKEKPR